jgi:endo-1,4-beta-xylanase
MIRFRHFLSLGLILLGSLAASGATGASPPVPPDGKPLVMPGDFRASGDADLFRFRSSGSGEAVVMEVVTRRTVSPTWAIQLIAPTRHPVHQGDIGLLRFRGRVTQTNHETGQGQVRATIQRMGGDYQRSAIGLFNLLPEWTEIFVPVRFAATYAAGEIGLYFAFGFPPQTVEITDVSLVHFGTAVAFDDLPRTSVTYQGQGPNAAWRKAALARIDAIRKGDLAITVADATGQPLHGATVSIEMLQHDYEFGTAAPFSLLRSEGPNGNTYREKLFGIFNAVGPENDLKWPAWAGDRGSSGPSRESTIETLRWLRQRQIPVRGHVLVWPGFNRLPRSVVALRDTPRQREIPGMIAEHIRDITTATAGLVAEWDVLNEPYSHHALMDLFGREIMADWFKLARENLGPEVPLYFNDWGNHDLAGDSRHLAHFIDTARFIMANGGPIDGLGLQCHIGGIPTAPEALLATFDHYQRELNLPLRITEFDFTTDNQQLQADYTRDFLIACFSHPLTAGVQFWGFWEGAHWRPEAALYTRDWKEKPNGAAVRQLLRETWWTREQGVTDSSGQVTARGFFGRYRIHATLDGRAVEVETLHRAGSGPTVVVLSLE